MCENAIAVCDEHEQCQLGPRGALCSMLYSRAFNRRHRKFSFQFQQFNRDVCLQMQGIKSTTLQVVL
jgi:hypothetical protein